MYFDNPVWKRPSIIINHYGLMSHFLMGNTLAKIIKWEVVKKFEPTNCLESCFQWKVHMNLYQIPSNGRVETWINGCNIINQIIFFKPSNKFGQAHEPNRCQFQHCKLICDCSISALSFFLPFSLFCSLWCKTHFLFYFIHLGVKLRKNRVRWWSCVLETIII